MLRSTNSNIRICGGDFARMAKCWNGLQKRRLDKWLARKKTGPHGCAARCNVAIYKTIQCALTPALSQKERESCQAIFADRSGLWVFRRADCSDPSAVC